MIMSYVIESVQMRFPLHSRKDPRFESRGLKKTNWFPASCTKSGCQQLHYRSNSDPTELFHHALYVRIDAIVSKELPTLQVLVPRRKTAYYYFHPTLQTLDSVLTHHQNLCYGVITTCIPLTPIVAIIYSFLGREDVLLEHFHHTLQQGAMTGERSDTDARHRLSNLPKKGEYILKSSITITMISDGKAEEKNFERCNGISGLLKEIQSL